MEPNVIENGRHMVMTNVNPERKTKYLNIDTRFQQEYNMNTGADVTVTLPQNIRDVHSMKMTHVEIPASFYDFSLTMRNTYFTINDTLIEIDEGNYTATELVTAVDTDVSFDNISASIDVNTQKCKIENKSGGDITVRFAVDDRGNEDKYSLKSKLGWCLGFREPVYIITNGGSIESEGIVNVNPCRYLFVSVDDFHAHNPNSFIVPSFDSYFDPNILSRVTIDRSSYNFGQYIIANESGGRLLSDSRTYKGKNDIQKIRVRVLNEIGEVINLNKMDFSFALEIKHD
jgi:hypothetical protein